MYLTCRGCVSGAEVEMAGQKMKWRGRECSSYLAHGDGCVVCEGVGWCEGSMGVVFGRGSDVEERRTK
jgi:hypothetical protein